MFSTEASRQNVTALDNSRILFVIDLSARRQQLAAALQ
jgi:hypothetical protein